MISSCIEALAFSFTLEELSLILGQSDKESEAESLALIMRALIVNDPDLPPILPLSYILDLFEDDFEIRDSICVFADPDFDVMGKLIRLIWPLAPSIEAPLAVIELKVDEMYATGYDETSFETYRDEERPIDADYIPTFMFDDDKLPWGTVTRDTKWMFIRLILPATPSASDLITFLRDFYEDYPFITHTNKSHVARVLKDIA